MHTHLSHGGRGERKGGGVEKEQRGMKRGEVRPLFSLTAVGQISLFLAGK